MVACFIYKIIIFLLSNDYLNNLHARATDVNMYIELKVHGLYM